MSPDADPDRPRLRAGILKVLAGPMRLRRLRALRDGKDTVGDPAPSAASAH